MNSSTVSVLIPMYNAEKYIEQALDSVLAQTYEGFVQIVVVDDGSTDNSSNVAFDWANKNNCSRFMCVKKDNGGSASARNYGLEYCSGDLISLLDADDLYNSERLEKLVPVIMSAEEIGVVYSAYYQFSDEKNLTEHLVGRDPYSIELLMRECCVTTGALIKKKYIEMVGGWNEEFRLIEDYEIYGNLSAICDMRYVDEPLFYYRKAGQNKTNEDVTTSKEWHKEHIMVKSGMAKQFGVYSTLKIANAMVGGIGDLVAISGVYKLMKEFFPDCKIAHTSYKGPFFDVIEYNPYIDHKRSTGNLIDGIGELSREFSNYRQITTDYFYRYGWNFWKTELNLTEFFLNDILNINVDKKYLKPEFYYNPDGSDFERYEKFSEEYGKDYIIVEGQTRSNKEGKEWRHFDCIYDRLDKIGIPIVLVPSPDTPEITGYKNVITVKDTKIREAAKFIEEANWAINLLSGQAWIADCFSKKGLMINIGPPYSYAGRSFGDIIIADQGELFSPESLKKETVLEKLEEAIERFN